ncbi:basal body protein 10-like [Miscanthus floridulus]|uniref:basal body protein 10-like n=1 Tax=Miscanthus floridulus TaxID=154761 RepID=UPI00345AEEC0
MPREAKACESDGAEAPSVADTTEGGIEASRTSEAEAMEAGAPRTAEADVAGTRAPETIEAGVAGTGAPKTTKAEVAGAGVIAAKPVAQEVEAEAGQASIPPSVQGPPLLQESARELESARSVKVEDLRLRYADMKAEPAMAQEQVAPLATRVKELEEELTLMAGDRDVFWSRAEEAMASAKALAGQLGVEQGAHLLAKGALAEALKGALHAGVKCALAIISSHYAGVDLEAVSDGYVLPGADEEVAKLIESAEGPGIVLAKLFEEVVVPPPPSADAGDPEP